MKQQVLRSANHRVGEVASRRVSLEELIVQECRQVAWPWGTLIDDKAC